MSNIIFLLFYIISVNTFYFHKAFIRIQADKVWLNVIYLYWLIIIKTIEIRKHAYLIGTHKVGDFGMSISQVFVGI
jgi:hypothetical protein